MKDFIINNIYINNGDKKYMEKIINDKLSKIINIINKSGRWYFMIMIKCDIIRIIISQNGSLFPYERNVNYFEICRDLCKTVWWG